VASLLPLPSLRIFPSVAAAAEGELLIVAFRVPSLRNFPSVAAAEGELLIVAFRVPSLRNFPSVAAAGKGSFSS
jgi:hypothetical protein